MDQTAPFVDMEALGRQADDILTSAQTSVETLLATPALYGELIAVLVICVLTHLGGRVLRHVIPPLRENEKLAGHSAAWFLMRSGRLIPPLLLLALLSLLNVFAAPYFSDGVFINIANKLAVLWLLWITLQAFVSNIFILSAASWILLPAAGLSVFGYYDMTVSWLDSIGFSLGELRITALTFIRTILIATFLIWGTGLISDRGVVYIRSRRGLNSSTRELLVKSFQILIYTFAFLLTLNLVGIDLTALAVFSGALGVGLGFGLQKIASNFISGMILLMERSVRIGNVVQLDEQTFGFLRKLGARASIIETYDGQEIMVPNEDFITSRVTNWTYSNNQARVHVQFGVSYDTPDLRLVEQLALKAALSYPGCVQDPEPRCFLREFGDSSVNFTLMFWVDYVKEGRYGARSAVLFALWDLLKEHHIEIPFPQRDVHLRSVPESLKKD